jgi:hypothetical protein
MKEFARFVQMAEIPWRPEGKSNAKDKRKDLSKSVLAGS